MREGDRNVATLSLFSASSPVLMFNTLPYIIKEFRCQICAIRPFQSYRRETILDKFVQIAQFTKHLTDKIRLQIDKFPFTVIEGKNHLVFLDIIRLQDTS